MKIGFDFCVEGDTLPGDNTLPGSFKQPSSFFLQRKGNKSSPPKKSDSKDKAVKTKTSVPIEVAPLSRAGSELGEEDLDEFETFVLGKEL